MTWSQRRQFTYATGFFAVVALIAFLIIRHVTQIVPTCYDNKKNGDEVGVDCGGTCAFYCKDELTEPKVRWVRFFTVTPGIVHAVAYIEHSYPTAAARKMSYEFRLYDEKNNILTTRTGSTYLGPMGRSAIVETLIPVGNTVPATARFVFTGTIPWEKIPVSYSQVVIKTDRYVLEAFDGGTRLTANLDNQSRMSFENIDVVGILYDKNDNAIAVSKSLLSSIPAEGSATIYFTWPDSNLANAVRAEILPRINPFANQPL